MTHHTLPLAPQRNLAYHRRTALEAVLGRTLEGVDRQIEDVRGGRRGPLPRNTPTHLMRRNKPPPQCLRHHTSVHLEPSRLQVGNEKTKAR